MKKIISCLAVIGIDDFLSFLTQKPVSSSQQLDYELKGYELDKSMPL